MTCLSFVFVFLTITNVFNLSRASCLLMLFVQNGYWRHISTVYVSYIQGKPCRVYLSHVASGVDSLSSYLTCLLIILSQYWYARDRTMPTMGHSSQLHTSFNKSICTSAYFLHQVWYFKRLKHSVLWFHCLMTTNGQLNNTCVYQIIATDFTCSMISGFRLKGPWSFVRGNKHVFVSAAKF